MGDNLALWSKVERTPTEHTKPITGKQYKGNSPKPHYLVWKATETFGPCGIGWGFEIVSERVEPGAGDDKLHIARVRVWYEWDGKRGTVEHVGQTLFSGKRRSGEFFTDEDAPKKSVTDALVKALSMIGFAGDIFMGRYDDSKYVAELKAEERVAAPPPPRKPNANPYKQPTADELIAELHKKAVADDLKAWGQAAADAIGKLPRAEGDRVRDAYRAHLAWLSERREAAE